MKVIKLLDRKSNRTYNAILGHLPLKIGRSRSTHLKLEGQTVSSVHCKVWEADGRVYYEDLDTMNGSYENGVKLKGVVELQYGTEINIGIGDALLYLDGKYKKDE